MDTIQHAVVSPVAKITIDRAFGRQVLGDVTPLASRAQHVHDAVENFSHVDFALAPATFRLRYQRLKMCPLLVGDIARISQAVAIVFHSIFIRPHRRSSTNQAAYLESQVIQGTQELSRRTLSLFFDKYKTFSSASGYSRHCLARAKCQGSIACTNAVAAKMFAWTLRDENLGQTRDRFGASETHPTIDKRTALSLIHI